MRSLSRFDFRTLSVLAAAGFALGVTFSASRSSGGDMVKKASLKLQAPDSVVIRTEDRKTAEQVVAAFQSAGHASQYSLAISEPLSGSEVARLPSPSVTGATSATYSLVLAYGDAPLRNMVLLEQHAVFADAVGLATIVGNDTADTNTTGGGTIGGGTSFTTGATNSNSGVTAGTLGVAVIDNVREALREINPALYVASYFNYRQVDQNLQIIQKSLNMKP